MKKILSIALVVCLALTAFLFVGCGAEKNNIVLEGGPELNETVLGNGSFSVRKGEYVYFASGFVKTSDLGTGTLTNNLGEVKNGAIYRAKVETVRTLIENSDPNAEPQYKEETKLTEVQLLCSKVAGFENSGLYIFGNKLYFATPSTAKNNSGDIQYSLLSFYSMDLNGENLKEIYTTPSFSGGSFSYILLDGNLYLLVYNGSNIVRVDVNGKTLELAKDVVSAVLPKAEIVAENSYSASANEKYVYYTVKNEDNTETRDYGTVLNKANILTAENTELFKEKYITVSLNKLENNKLYYTRNKMLSSMSPSSESYLFANDLSGATFAESEKQLSNQKALTNVIDFKYEASEMDGYVYVSGGKLYYTPNNEFDPKTLADSASKVLFVQGKYVYYTNSSSVYRVDVTEETPSEKKLSDTHSIEANYVDIDANFVYFYVNNTTAKIYETYYIDIVNFVSGTTKPVKVVA